MSTTNTTPPTDLSVPLPDGFRESLRTARRWFDMIRTAHSRGFDVHYCQGAAESSIEAIDAALSTSPVAQPNLRAAAQAALDVLTTRFPGGWADDMAKCLWDGLRLDTADALRAALAQQPASGAPFGYMDKRTLDSMSKLSPRGYVMPVITRSAFDDCTVPVYAGAAPAAAQPDPRDAEIAQLRRAIGTVCEGWTLPPGVREVLESALWSVAAAAAGEQAPRQPLTDEQRRRIILGCDTLGEAISETERAHGIGAAPAGEQK